MKNFVQNGKIVTVTSPYALSSGDGALVGVMFGVAAADYANGATDAELQMEGVFDIKRTTGASTAWTEGAIIYWDNTAKTITKTVGSNTKIGVAVLPLPVDADLLGRVRLNGSF